MSPSATLNKFQWPPRTKSGYEAKRHEEGIESLLGVAHFSQVLSKDPAVFNTTIITVMLSHPTPPAEQSGAKQRSSRSSQI